MARLICPSCGSTNIQAVGRARQYSCCLGCIGSLIFGWIGWLLGLIGKAGKYEFSCMDCGRQFRKR